MKSPQEEPKKPQTGNKPLNDDLWLGDLPNDLEAISLSSDNIPALPFGELGGAHEKNHAHSKAQSHKHRDVGF